MSQSEEEYSQELSSKSSTPISSPSSSQTVTQVVSIHDLIDGDINSHLETKIRHFVEPYISKNQTSNNKIFRTTIEIPPAHLFNNEEDHTKLEPDQSPDYKLQPILSKHKTTTTSTTTTTTTTTTTDSPVTTSIPRVSRVNTAIKSQIAFGGARRQNVKCHENQTTDTKCHDHKQRYLFLLKYCCKFNLHEHRFLHLIFALFLFNLTYKLFTLI